MKQQVNLYLEEFRPKHVVLPAKKMLSILVAFSVFLVVINIALLGLQLLNEDKLEMLTSELITLKNDNSKMQSKLGGMVVGEDLKMSVAQSARQLKARQRILTWVEESNSEKRVNFSALLEGLGRQQLSGLWFSAIEINAGGRSLSLHGNTLDPELMPILLEKLNSEPAFVGREFKKVLMEKDPDLKGVMNFVLTTETPAGPVYGEQAAIGFAVDQKVLGRGKKSG